MAKQGYCKLNDLPKGKYIHLSYDGSNGLGGSTKPVDISVIIEEYEDDGLADIKIFNRNGENVWEVGSEGMSYLIKIK